MSRKNDKTLMALIILFVGLVTIFINFLREVNRLKLWPDFFKSTAIFAVLNLVGYAIATQTSMGVFVFSLLITFILYCIYWGGKFTYSSTRLNAEMRKKKQWWWTLDGWQFEQEVANVFRMYNYKAKVTKGSGDGGVDIILRKNGYITIVQCKHYKNPVPPEPVRALWGCKDDFNASEVILVASSGLTTSAMNFVRNKQGYKVLNLDDIVMMAEKSLIQEETKKQVVIK